MSHAKYHPAPTTGSGAPELPQPRPHSAPRRNAPTDGFVYNHAAFTKAIDNAERDHADDPDEVRLPLPPHELGFSSPSSPSSRHRRRRRCLFYVLLPSSVLFVVVILFVVILQASQHERLVKKLAALEDELATSRRAYQSRSLVVSAATVGGVRVNGHATLLNITDVETSEATICLKAKTPLAGFGPLFHVRHAGANPASQVALHEEGGVFRAFVADETKRWKESSVGGFGSERGKWSRVCLTLGPVEETDWSGSAKGPSPSLRLHLKVNGHEAFTAEFDAASFRLRPGAFLQIGRFVDASVRDFLGVSSHIFEGEVSDVNVWRRVLPDDRLDEASMRCPRTRHTGDALGWFPMKERVVRDGMVEAVWRQHCWEEE